MSLQATKMWVAVSATLIATILAVGGVASAEDITPSLGSDPSVLVATTQTIIVGLGDLVVNVNGKSISAMPFRIRLIGQASPYAYSLDVTRRAEYGDSWTGLSLGRPHDNSDRSLSRIGVNDPDLANVIARGNQTGNNVLYADSNLELAARQVAIWSYTNGLALVPHVVPNAELLTRAQQLASGAKDPRLSAQLQPAHYSIGVFVRETTGNSVRLAISLGVDQNSSLVDPATIALSIDGEACKAQPDTPEAVEERQLGQNVCQVRTRGQTRVEQDDDGTYQITSHEDYRERTHSTQVAEVDLPRNTKVVSLSANWVNVTAQPGLIMAGNGSAPPLATAEAATLNFTTTAQLDPAAYTGPTQLLSKAGTAALTHVPSWGILFVLILALYLIARAGRGADKAFGKVWRKLRGKPADTVVKPSSVLVEADTEQEAIDVGLATLGLPASATVNLQLLQPATPPAPGQPATPVKLRMSLP